MNNCWSVGYNPKDKVLVQDSGATCGIMLASGCDVDKYKKVVSKIATNKDFLERVLPYKQWYTEEKSLTEVPSAFHKGYKRVVVSIGLITSFIDVFDSSSYSDVSVALLKVVSNGVCRFFIFSKTKHKILFFDPLMGVISTGGHDDDDKSCWVRYSYAFITTIFSDYLYHDAVLGRDSRYSALLLRRDDAESANKFMP